MVFQKVIEIEEVGEFDTFCDKFEPYLDCILNLVEIDRNSIVSEEDFSTDIEKIINFILGKNDSIINNNYELVE